MIKYTHNAVVLANNYFFKGDAPMAKAAEKRNADDETSAKLNKRIQNQRYYQKRKIERAKLVSPKEFQRPKNIDAINTSTMHDCATLNKDKDKYHKLNTKGEIFSLFQYVKIISLSCVILFFLAILITTSKTVYSSSTTFFGLDLIGYCRAIAIECGSVIIIFLSAKTTFTRLFKHTCIIATLALGAVTYYSHYNVSSAQIETESYVKSTKYQRLSDQREAKIKLRDDISPTQISRKIALQTEIDGIDRELSLIEEKSPSSNVTTAAQFKARVLFFMQLILMVLVLFFASSLKSQLGIISQYLRYHP